MCNHTMPSDIWIQVNPAHSWTPALGGTKNSANTEQCAAKLPEERMACDMACTFDEGGQVQYVKPQRDA